MKDRVVLFSDAVIAIILTVMVVEFPVDIVNGQVQLGPLFVTIGIYFISFCFVANIWFQTAQRFNLVDEVTNRDLVFYLISLFLLSLVPKATDVLIEETSQSTVTIYGVLTLMVVFFTQGLISTLAEQAVSDQKTSENELDRLRKRGWGAIFSRVLLLIVGFFLPRFSLVVYMILPIIDFLQNAIDHEETEFLEQMPTDQRAYYQEDQKDFWHNNFQKYGTLVRSALQGTVTAGDNNGNRGNERRPDWWQDFDRQYHDNLNQEILNLQKELTQTTDEQKRTNLAKKISRLEEQKATIQAKMKVTQERFNQRAAKWQQILENRLKPVEEEIADLQLQIQASKDQTQKVKLQKQLDQAQQRYQGILAENKKRTEQNQRQAMARMRNLAKPTTPDNKKVAADSDKSNE